MNAQPDLRGLTRPELDALAERLEVLRVLEQRFGSSVLYARPGESDYPLTLSEALGTLSAARLRDISAAITRLARLAMLDGLLSGEAVLHPLSDEALLKRLGEISSVVAQKGIAGLRVDRAQEGGGLAGDPFAHTGGVLRNGGREQAGDKRAPNVRTMRGVITFNDDTPWTDHDEAPVKGGGAAPP